MTVNVQDDIPLLDALMQDMERYPAHQPTNFWKPYVARIDHAIRQDGLSAFRSNRAIIKGYEYTTLPGENPMRRNRFARFADTCMRVPPLSLLRKPYQDMFYKLQEQVREGIAREYRLLYQYCATEPRMRTILKAVHEQGVGDPVTISIDERAYSENLLNHIPAVSLMTTVRPLAQTKRILEIGGGYGVFAQIITRLQQDVLDYLVMVDIPPVLYVATQYLKALFPDRVLDYRAVRDVQTIDARMLPGKILLIPPWMLERLACDFDLLWSVGAFQEMEKDRVEMYLDQGAKRCASIFTSGLIRGHAPGAGGQREPIAFDWIVDAICARGYTHVPLPSDVPERTALRACVANYDFGYFEKVT